MGRPSASCIACDCSRSSEAAIGSASAVAGSARYVIVVHSDVESPPAANPPTGNHPVRDARRRSANDVTRGGTETKMSESARASAVPRLRRLPVMMPAGTPTSVARSRAVAPSSAVFQARSATSCGPAGRTSPTPRDRAARRGPARRRSVRRTGDRVRGGDARPRRPPDRGRTRRPNRRGQPRPASAPPTRRRTRAAPRRAGGEAR